MARGFHKPGSDQDRDQRAPEQPRERESQDQARSKDAPQSNSSFPENPRQGKAYDDEPRRPTRSSNDRIGSGYGNRHQGRSDGPPRERRDFSPRERYNDRPRDDFGGDRERRYEDRGPRDFDHNRREDRSFRPDDRREHFDDRRFDNRDRPTHGRSFNDRQFDDRRRQDGRPRYDDRRDRYDDRRPRYDNDRRDNRYDDRRPRYDDRRPTYEDRGRERYDDRRPRYDDRRDNRYDDRRPRYDDRRDHRYEDRRSNNFRDDRYGRGQNESRGFRSRDDRGGHRSFRDADDRRDGPPSRSQEWRQRGRDQRNRPAPRAEKEKRRFKPPTPPNLDPSTLNEPIRLNKFLARSTSYSRRDADDLIKRGRVTVNDEVVAPGYMVQPGDVVLFDEKPVTRRDHLAYILINKPRGLASTTDPSVETDEAAPSTLAGLLKFDGVDKLNAVLPLGDDMMGLQLVSNDPRLEQHFEQHAPKETFTLVLTEPGAPDLTHRLAPEGAPANHPVLVAEFTDDERTRLSIVVRGGYPQAFIDEIGLEPERVDRLHFAGLTKKDLPRGHWRFLSDREITWVTKFQQ